jgi:hypothetical protein
LGTINSSPPTRVFSVLGLYPLRQPRRSPFRSYVPAPRKLVISASNTCCTTRSTNPRRKSSPPNPPCHPSTIPIPSPLRAICVVPPECRLGKQHPKESPQVARIQTATQQLLQNSTDSIGKSFWHSIFL